MLYFAAAAIGLVVGVVEFFLLRALVRNVMSNDAIRAFIIVPIKLIVLAAGLLAVFFIAPELLWLAGVCVVLPLLIGAILTWAVSRRGGGADSEEKDQTRRD